MSAETPEPARLDQYHKEWGWHEATDDLIAGYGHHMAQMLYRLPIDSQTEDMRTSILAMLEDLDRLAAVEAERDAARGALDVAPEVLRLAEISNQIGAWRTRAEKAEATLARLRADVAALAERARQNSDTASRRELQDPNAYARRVVWDSVEHDLRAVLDQHPGPDHMQGEA